MRWFLFLATVVLLAAAALACGGDVRQGAPNLGKGTQGADSWELSFDTTAQANGVYTLVALPFDADQPGQGTPPLDIAQVEVTIANGAAR